MKSLLAFLGGAVAGAAIALLLAPEKGEVTRKKILQKGEEARQRVRDIIGEKTDELEEEVQGARIRANNAARRSIKRAAATVKEI